MRRAEKRKMKERWVDGINIPSPSQHNKDKPGFLKKKKTLLPSLVNSLCTSLPISLFVFSSSILLSTVFPLFIQSEPTLPSLKKTCKVLDGSKDV